VKTGVGNKERVTPVASQQGFANEFRRLHESVAAATATVTTATARCSGAKLFAAVVAMGKNRPHCDRERIRQVGTVDVDLRSCRGKPKSSTAFTTINDSIRLSVSECGSGGTTILTFLFLGHLFF
jgi:hypothetical protein